MILPVTVVIPFYNSSDCISAVLNAISAQSALPSQVVIVDDGSTPDEAHALREVVGQSSLCVRIVTLNKNMGPGYARNAGWDSASTEFIAFCDSDDIWTTEKLRTQVSWMESNSDVLLSCHGTRVAGNGRALPFVSRVTLRSLILRNSVATSTVIVRREVAERFGTKRRYSEDFYLWLTLSAKQTPMILIGADLSEYGSRLNPSDRLSSKLWRMEFAEIANFIDLAVMKKVPVLLAGFGVVISIAKFSVRLARAFVTPALRRTRRVRRRFQGGP